MPIEFSYNVQTWHNVNTIAFCRQGKEFGKIPILSLQNFSTSQALISLKFSEFATDN